MINRNWIRTLWVLPVLVFVAITSGCEDPGISEPEEPELPISNERILLDMVSGAPTMNSSIYDLYDDGNGEFYFRGKYEGEYCVAVIDQSAQTDWMVTFDEKPRALYPLPDNDIGLTEAVLSVGEIYCDDDDQTYEACVRLIGSGGGMIDELIINRSDTAMWFNSVDAIGPLSFVAVGGAKIADVYYPYVTTFKINPDSTLEMSNEKIFHDVANQFFTVVEVDAGQVSGDDFLCYISAAQRGPGDGADKIAVHAMTGSTSDIAAFDLTWTVEISQDDNLDIWSPLGCLVLHDGTLYLVGGMYVEKESNPPDGYWQAGFVGSVSTSGSLNWINKIIISKYSENYYGLCVTDDALYAVGRFACYSYLETERSFGFALLSIFDTVTGDELYHLAFGNEEYRSDFNSLIVKGTMAYCGGNTNWHEDDGGYQAWFAEIDIDNLDGTVTSELPALSPTVKGAERVPASHMQTRERRGAGSDSGRFRE